MPCHSAGQMGESRVHELHVGMKPSKRGVLAVVGDFRGLVSGLEGEATEGGRW